MATTPYKPNPRALAAAESWRREREIGRVREETRTRIERAIFLMVARQRLANRFERGGQS